MIDPRHKALREDWTKQCLCISGSVRDTQSASVVVAGVAVVLTLVWAPLQGRRARKGGPKDVLLGCIWEKDSAVSLVQDRKKETD